MMPLYYVLIVFVQGSDFGKHKSSSDVRAYLFPFNIFCFFHAGFLISGDKGGQSSDLLILDGHDETGSSAS